MKMVVGLGNPGKEYEKTRHNCGFLAIDYYAKNNNLDFKSKFKGLYCEKIIDGSKIIFLKPQTYMNLSGDCVKKFVDYYNLSSDDIIDDIDFEVGTFKIKRDGSSAGHNGINSIINRLNTENINRIRIGISKNEIPLEKYVLQKFSKEEQKKIDSIMPTIENIINDYSKNDIDYLMQKYNGN